MSPETNTETPKMILYRGFPLRTRYTVSPFVTKLEFRLRHAGLPYDAQCGSPRSAPMGKIPYVALNPGFGEKQGQGAEELMGDSALIIKRLVDEGRIEDLNGKAGLDGKGRLADQGVCALLEERLYLFQGRERWLDNYYTQRDTVLCTMPYPLRVVIGVLIYRKYNQMMQSQGVGRYTGAQCKEMREEIWGGVSEGLKESLRVAEKEGEKGNEKGKEPFWCLGGSGPTECDAVVYGFLVSVLMSDASPASRDFVRSMPVLMEYAKRIHERWFPDYEMW